MNINEVEKLACLIRDVKFNDFKEPVAVTGIEPKDRLNNLAAAIWIAQKMCENNKDFNSALGDYRRELEGYKFNRSKI